MSDLASLPPPIVNSGKTKPVEGASNSIEDGAKVYMEAFNRSARLSRSQSFDEQEVCAFILFFLNLSL